MKSKGKPVAALLALLIAAYLFCTPTGALRRTLLLAGYPVSAVFLSAREASASDVGVGTLEPSEHTTIYRILSPVPHESATDADLENWIVTQHGLFYTAEYYGWC